MSEVAHCSYPVSQADHDAFVTEDFMQDYSTAAVARVASPTLDGRKKAVARAQLAIRSVQ